MPLAAVSVLILIPLGMIAQDIYDKYFNKQAADIVYWVEMGGLKEAIGQMALIIPATLNMIARTRPDYRDIQFSRGWALGNPGQRKLAVPVYRAHIILHPTDAQRQLNPGYSLIEMGDCKGAIPPLRAVLALDPSNAVARQDLTVCQAG